MTKEGIREDYSITDIRDCLRDYNSLQAGNVPERILRRSDWGFRIDKGRAFRAPFELAVILLSDIDTAFSKLPRTEQFVVLAYLMDGRGLDWCAYSMRISEKDVENITTNAIQIMYEILNGRKQRRN